MSTAIEGPSRFFLLRGPCGHSKTPVDVYTLKAPSKHFQEFLVQYAALVLPSKREDCYHELLGLWVKHALREIPLEFWDKRFDTNVIVPQIHNKLPVCAINNLGIVSLFPNMDVGYRSRVDGNGLRLPIPDESLLSPDYFN